MVCSSSFEPGMFGFRLRRNSCLGMMEKRKDKIQDDDLAIAKRDLLMRFIKDQESLQTSQTDVKPTNNDKTLDILDRLVVSKELSPNKHNKGRGDLRSNLQQNDHVSKIRRPDEVGGVKGGDLRYRVMSSRTCTPKNFIRSETSGSIKVTGSNRNLQAKEERIRPKSSVKLDNILYPTERPCSVESHRRLRSAPALSLGEDQRQLVTRGEINAIEARHLKSRALSSLSTVVPTDSQCTIKQHSTRSCQKHSVTCSHIAQPLNCSSITMGIPSVDVQLLDRTVSLGVFHLPPIVPGSTGTPPTTQ